MPQGQVPPRGVTDVDVVTAPPRVPFRSVPWGGRSAILAEREIGEGPGSSTRQLVELGRAVVQALQDGATVRGKAIEAAHAVVDQELRVATGGRRHIARRERSESTGPRAVSRRERRRSRGTTRTEQGGPRWRRRRPDWSGRPR